MYVLYPCFRFLNIIKKIKLDFTFGNPMFCELLSIWRLIHGMGCSKKRNNGLDKVGMAHILLYINACSKISIVSVASNTKRKPSLG